MEKFYQTAQKLVEGSVKLADELFKFNPSFEENEKKSLATLAGMARELEYKFKSLRIDLTEKHEREQRNAIFQKHRI